MPEAMTRVLNLWGGPCAGKSTTAAGLFVQMKLAGIRCELVTEYAKEKTYEQAWSTIADQWYVTGQQQRRLRRLVGKVDWIITDSPLPVGLLYVEEPFRQQWFTDAVWGLFDQFANVNVFLERTHAYETYGRYHTEAEAIVKDSDLRGMAGDRIDHFVKIGLNTSQVIFEKIFEPV
jgi:hypothetical protein